jgi:hypothetical protein
MRTSSEPSRGPLDTVLRGLVMVALGALMTSPMWFDSVEATTPFRASTTFRAPREEETLEGRVGDTLRRCLTDAARGRAFDEDAVAIELSTILADANVGTPRGRTEAVTSVLDEIAGQAAEGDARGLGDMQERAIASQSRVMARSLIERLGGVIDAEDTDDPPGDWVPAPWPLLTRTPFDEERPELPADVRAFDGKDVKAWGYLLQLEGDQFLLVQSLWSCCFGTPPDLHEAIVVRCNPDHASRFEGRGVRLYGRMEVGPEYDEGYVTSVYRLDARHVRGL